MKKRLLALLLCISMSVTLVACGGANESAKDKNDTSQTAESDDKQDENKEDTSVTEEKEAEKDKEKDSQKGDESEDDANKSLMGFNMVTNPDFAEKDEVWFLYTNAGAATLSYENEELVVKVEKLGKEEHGVQIYYDGFTLETGCEYELQFDASSSAEREIQYRAQLNGGDYHAYNAEYITLTPEMQHYDIKFTMEESSDPAPRLCFNMGLINGNELGEHELHFDNFEFFCIDESGRVMPEEAVQVPDIAINQLGYRPDDSKMAVFASETLPTDFAIVKADTGETVFEGRTDEPKENNNTRRMEIRGDFSSFTEPGTYKIVADEAGESYEFTIGDDVYDDAFNAVVKMFYMQRCGMALDKKYAGDFAHKVCHNSKATVYGTSEKVDVSGGWHDAGDYGRYVVSAAKAAVDLMLAYEKYPDAFSDEVGIPESGNGTPDVLDEIRYELEWMLKMQAKDGGVYHKVTCANFPETVMPEDEKEELILSPVSTAATADFVATMAMAYEVYGSVDSKFADQCLEAAKLSLDYLENNEAKGFTNPEDIVTGEYPDGNLSDEFFWAYAEMFKATGDSSYEKKISEMNRKKINYGLGWADVGFYGAYAYLTADCKDTEVKAEVLEKLEKATNLLVKNIDRDTYGCALFHDFVWGSNMLAADNGMALSLYGEIVGKDFSKESKMQLDYLLGTNANNYCFVTGFGTLSPNGTHHRPSQFLGQTMEGMLVGGPNSHLEDPYANAVLKGKPEAMCYVDNSQSYSCNEITVYWNSPLVYLMAECR